MNYDAWKSNEPDPNAGEKRPDEDADFEEGQRFQAHLVSVINDVFEDKCSSMCLDNDAERKMVARFVALELISKGMVQP